MGEHACHWSFQLIFKLGKHCSCFGNFLQKVRERTQFQNHTPSNCSEFQSGVPDWSDTHTPDAIYSQWMFSRLKSHSGNWDQRMQSGFVRLETYIKRVFEYLQLCCLKLFSDSDVHFWENDGSSEWDFSGASWSHFSLEILKSSFSIYFFTLQLPHCPEKSSVSKLNNCQPPEHPQIKPTFLNAKTFSHSVTAKHTMKKNWVKICVSACIY